MDHARFWELIEHSHSAAAGDPDRQVDILCSAVARLDEDKMVQFLQLHTYYYHRAFRWDLWAAAYIMGGGCGDDSFMDVRNWLISLGRRAYEAVLQDVERLADYVVDGEEPQSDGAAFVGFEAKVWRLKTGDEHYDPRWPRPSHPREPVGSKWKDDAELATRYPKLWKRFGW